MKRFLVLFAIIILTMLVTVNNAVKAINFESVFRECDKKPLLVLIVADWADSSDAAKQQFDLVKKHFGNRLNYTVLNIASEDAAIYNKNFRFEANIPYVVFFRSGGKVSRFLSQNCALNANACMIPRIKTFYSN